MTRARLPLIVAGCAALALTLTACEKPNPGATVFSGTSSEYSLAACWADEGGQIDQNQCAQDLLANAASGQATKPIPVVPGEVIGRFVDLDRLEVRAAVPIAYQSQLSAGDRLDVTTGAGTKREGTVRTLIASGDPASQTFELRIDLAKAREAARDIMPGQLVKVDLPLESGRPALVVPRDAVVVRREGSYVFRVNSASVAERVPVTVGAGKGAQVAVNGELKAGEQVVVRGADRLEDGQKVRRRGQG